MNGCTIYSSCSRIARWGPPTSSSLPEERTPPLAPPQHGGRAIPDARSSDLSCSELGARQTYVFHHDRQEDPLKDLARRMSSITAVKTDHLLGLTPMMSQCPGDMPRRAGRADNRARAIRSGRAP